MFQSGTNRKLKNSIFWAFLVTMVLTVLICFTSYAAEPSIVITKGNPSAPTPAPYTILFYVTDDSGVVSIIVNGSELGPNGGTFYDAEWTTYHNGEIVITATDNEGYSSTCVETITNVVAGGAANNYYAYTPDEDYYDEPIYNDQPDYQSIPVQPQVQSQPQVQIQTVPQAQVPQQVQVPQTQIVYVPVQTIEETSPAIQESEAETEKQPETEAFEYYKIPEKTTGPEIPPVSRLNTIASYAIGVGKGFRVSVPKVPRIAKIVQSSITKGSTFRTDTPVAPSLTKTARFALNKGMRFRLSVPRAPSIVKLVSQILKHTGTEIAIPESVDISDIVNIAMEKGKSLNLAVPSIGSVYAIAQKALEIGSQLSTALPVVPDLSAIMGIAMGTDFAKEGARAPRLGEYTIVSTYTAIQQRGLSTAAKMIIVLLIAFILMEIIVVNVNKKSQMLYKWFVEAYNKKGGF